VSEFPIPLFTPFYLGYSLPREIILRILYVAEMVGKAGLFTLKSLLPKIKEEHKIDFTIGNGDGITGGFGIGKNHAHYLHKLGVNVITNGECVYFKRDVHQVLSGTPFVLRPGNFPQKAPGRGWKTYEVGDQKIVVLNLLGVSGFTRVHPGNPFQLFDLFMEKITTITPFIFVDFHGATTAEKNTFFHYADGRVSAIFGSHQKVQTADARVLPKGTGIITDAGRTGSNESVGGFEPQTEIFSFRTGAPQRSKEFQKGLEFQGVIVDINAEGLCQEITSLRIPCTEEYQGGES
jgi:metallophosphoesterase (TIGR00282 family)